MDPGRGGGGDRRSTPIWALIFLNIDNTFLKNLVLPPLPPPPSPNEVNPGSPTVPCIFFVSFSSVNMKVCRNKRGHLVEEAKLFIAYHLFQHYKDNPAQPVVILFDFVDSGVSNMVSASS